MDAKQVWGVVRRLEVEADTAQALLGACMVAAVQHSKATHYLLYQTEDGGNAISLAWMDATGYFPLPFDLIGADQITQFCRQWLDSKAVYPKKVPNTDGDVKRGFRIEIQSFHEVLCLKPAYIVYGK